MKKILTLLAIFLVLPQICLAVGEISNAHAVGFLDVQVLEKGKISVSGDVNEIEVELTIPQEDVYQKIIERIVISNNQLCDNQNDCSYSYITDDVGNQKLKIVWANPDSDINFDVRTDMKINRRTKANFEKSPSFLEDASEVEVSNPSIRALAFEITENSETDFEKIAEVTKWLNENIVYDKTMINRALNAKNVLEKKRSVCGGYSNLAAALLRNLGYQTAYIAGYAYSDEGEFIRHAWNEVYTDTDSYTLDSTWGEIPIDATHIKFAVQTGGPFVMAQMKASGYGDFSTVLEDTESYITLNEFTYNSIVFGESNLVKDELWRGTETTYALLESDLESDGCILTKVRSQSCILGESEFLRPVTAEEIVYFCDNKKYFSLFEVPVTDKGMEYTCALEIFPFSGTKQSDTIVIKESEAPTEPARIDTNEVFIKAGEEFTATSNGFIYTDYGASGNGELSTTAPLKDFKVYGYNGYLLEQEINVVEEKLFDIELTVDEPVKSNEEVRFSLFVNNLLDDEQEISTVFRGKTDTRTVTDNEMFEFSYNPSGPGDNVVTVFVKSGDFSTSVSKTIAFEEGGYLQTFWNSFMRIINKYLG